jgi:hypothetical protein
MDNSNISKELEFLKTWGSIFKQSAKDYPLRTYFRRHYEVCIDAHLLLQGKKSHFNSDVQKGLENIQNYMKVLGDEGMNTMEITRQRTDFIGSIAFLLVQQTQIGQTLKLAFQ